MDLNDMMVFLAVAETGSFTLAADRLNTPKSNVSRKISRLEQTLGVTLLERSTRAQHLTEAGRTFLQHARRIYEEVDLAQSEVSQLLSRYSGQLKIGTSISIGQQILKPKLADFLQKYPKVNVQLDLLNQRVDLIEQGYDMLIRVGGLDDSRLIAKKLKRVRRLLFASPDYFINRTIPNSPDDLCTCDLLFMKQLHRANTLTLHDKHKQHHIKTTPRMITEDFEILKQLTIDGLGIAILPEHMASAEIQSGQLIHVLPRWQMTAVDIYALYPPNRTKIAKVKAFLDFATQLFDTLPMVKPTN